MELEHALAGTYKSCTTCGLAEDGPELRQFDTSHLVLSVLSGIEANEA